MPENSFYEYPIIFIVAGLFVLAMVNVATMTGQNYGVSDVLPSDKVNFTSLERTINQTNSNARSWEKTFKSDNLFVVIGNVVLQSIWTLTTLIWNSVTSIFIIIIDGTSAVIGIPPIVTGVLLTCLILVLMFSAWRMIRSGQ